MKEPLNQFESLRQPAILDSVEIRENLNTISVFDSRRENVKIIIAKVSDRCYAAGYDIYFKSGRHASLLPTCELGWFLSENEAVLYWLGYIKKYASMFSDDAICAVEHLIGKFQQTSLF